MATPTFEDRGHDPYNYTGRQALQARWLYFRDFIIEPEPRTTMWYHKPYRWRSRLETKGGPHR